MNTLQACLIAWVIALFAKLCVPSVPWLFVAIAPLGWYLALAAAAATAFAIAICVMSALLFVEYLIDGKHS